MKRLPVGRDLARWFLSFGVLIAGVGVLGTGFALALESRNYSDPLTQFVPSLYYVGMAIGSLSGRLWLKWLGALRVFVLSAVSGGVLCLCVLKATTPEAWAILRFLHGVCLAGIYISVEVALNTATDNHHRGRVVALYQVVTYAAIAMGQWVVGYLWWGEVGWFIAAAALLGAGGVIAWWSIPVQPEGCLLHRVVTRDIDNSQNAASHRHGSVRLGLYVAGVAGVLLGSFYTVFPVVVHDLMAGLSATGNYLAAATLAALPALLMVSRFADRYGRGRAIALVSMVMTCALFFLVVCSERWVLWLAGMIYAGLLFTAYGLGIGDVNDRIRDDQRETAAAWLMSSFSLGGCIGPWLSGWAYAVWGAEGYFAVSGVAAASILIVCFVTRLHQRIGSQGAAA